MLQPVENQTIMITGATDGLGKKAVLDLAARKAGVIIRGSNPRKGEVVAKEIREATGNPRITYYNADFSALDEVRMLAGKIRADQGRLDVLITAGVKSALDPMLCPYALCSQNSQNVKFELFFARYLMFYFRARKSGL